MNKDYLLFHKPFISEEEIDEMVDTLRSGWLSMGPKTIRFEEEFNKYIGSKKSVAVSSWTAAGHLTLEAFGIQKGDEVILPTMTFPATAEIVCYFGAKPIIVCLLYTSRYVIASRGNLSTSGFKILIIIFFII